MAIYYVSNASPIGNDSNDGLSTEAPWLTINKVNISTFGAGDSILFNKGCTWRELLTVPSSGSSGNPITFGAYGSGLLPIINGADLTTSWTVYSGNIWQATVTTQPKQVFFNGIRGTLVASIGACTADKRWFWGSNTLYTYATQNPNTTYPNQIEVSQRDQCVFNDKPYITFSNLDLEKSNYDNLGTFGGIGTYITGVTSQYAIRRGIELWAESGTTVTYCTTAYNLDSGITFQESPNLLIDHCISHHNCLDVTNTYASGIKGGIDSAGQTTNSVIQYCSVYSNGPGVAGYIGGGIINDTLGTGSIIRYNAVWDNDNAGIDIDGYDGASVYYNLVWGNNKQSNVGSGGILAQADQSPYIRNTLIYNNTIYGNYLGGIFITGQFPKVVNGCIGNIVKNNIITGTISGPALLVNDGAENDGTYGSGNVYTYNNFGPNATNFIMWGEGTYYSTLAEWQTASSQTNNLNADPLFVSTTDFHLQPTSPCIDAGVSVSLTTDYDGRTVPHGTLPDVGAYEFYGSLVHSKGEYTTLPANANNLTTLYTIDDYRDIVVEDANLVSQAADDSTYYAVHEFKDYIGTRMNCTVTWKGQTDKDPATSTVYLQIYNLDTTTWDTIDTDNTSNPNVSITLTATVSDLTNYKDGSNNISCRVYQKG